MTARHSEPPTAEDVLKQAEWVKAGAISCPPYEGRLARVEEYLRLYAASLTAQESLCKTIPICGCSVESVDHEPWCPVTLYVAELKASLTVETTQESELQVVVNGAPVTVKAGAVRDVIREAIQLAGQIGAPIEQWELRTREGEVIPHTLSDGGEWMLSGGRLLFLNLGLPPAWKTPETPQAWKALETLCEEATPGPWAWGRLISDQAGDYVVWQHRGAQEGEPTAAGYSGKGPQRTYVGNVGGFIQPVIEADINDVLANQVFEAESADAAFIAAARTAVPELLRALKGISEENKRLREVVHVGAELDNHHNALACPYCNPKGECPLCKGEGALFAATKDALTQAQAENERLKGENGRRAGEALSLMKDLSFATHRYEAAEAEVAALKGRWTQLKAFLNRALPPSYYTKEARVMVETEMKRLERESALAPCEEAK